jgi:hypothetical protein
MRGKNKKKSTKRIQKNRIEKNEDQIWYKNKMKSNVEGWKWKDKSNQEKYKTKTNNNQNNEEQIWYKN